MRFFVNSWIFGLVKLEEVVKRVADIGFDGIELVGEPKRLDSRQVSILLSDYNLDCQSLCGIHPGSEEGDLRMLSHPDAAERSKAVDYVKGCIDLAQGVGARSVLVVPSLVGRPSPAISKEADWANAVESLAKAAEYAEQTGVYLTIEPINRYEVGLVNSVTDSVAMAKEVDHPFVRAMGDTFHMQLEERDGIPSAIRSAGTYWFQHLHAADNTREAPGMGTMPWRDILRALYDIHYEGEVSYEPLPRGASPYDAFKGVIPPERIDRELRFSLSYLKREEAIIREEFN